MTSVLVQLITGDIVRITEGTWFPYQDVDGKNWRLHFLPPGPTKELKFWYDPIPFVPDSWVEVSHLSQRTDEPLIAVETNDGDIVHVPIKWLMGGDPPWNALWTVAYHLNGEAMTRRSKIENKEFMRSVRRTDIREILG